METFLPTYTVTLPAAIFDWDGVVVDSSRLHVLSWERLALLEEHHLPEMVNLGSLGLKTQAVISDLLHWTHDPHEVERMTLRKEQVFRELAREHGIDSQPGVLDFLRGLKKLGIPAAVGSSAPRLNVEACMEVLGAQDLFQAVVSGDDVTHGKPAPDIFLKAAEQLGTKPEHSVVFEDATAGVKAARNAGMRVVAVLTTHAREALPDADLYIKDFTDFPAERFAGWYAGLK